MSYGGTAVTRSSVLQRPHDLVGRKSLSPELTAQPQLFTMDVDYDEAQGRSLSTPGAAQRIVKGRAARAFNADWPLELSEELGAFELCHNLF